MEPKRYLIIGDEQTRLGIGNNVLNNLKSIIWIICLIINAFEVYDKILNAALKVDKNNKNNKEQLEKKDLIKK